MGEGNRKLQFVQELLLAAAAPLLAYFVARQFLNQLQNTSNSETQEAERKAKAASKRLNGIFGERDHPSSRDRDGASRLEDDDRLTDHDRPRIQDLHLNSYEQSIAMEVVAPEEIRIGFDDIGGLDDIIEELKESVIYPLTLPHLYAHSSSLLSAPSGVLLYGPPGCGKTMLAKALAHESGACFINLHISTLTEKWYGDSNKLVSAVFSLARKLQPAIVFIDEIDAVLGQRRSGEHEASGMVKAEFMTHWDGLTSSNSTGTPQRICILGATNRIQDIDEAILRRMPKKFPISLPSAPQRRNIFKLILRDTKIDRPNFDLDGLVRLSAGMSGSDIKESCRDAAMVPVREYIRTQRSKGTLRKGVDPRDVRGVRTEDFFGRRGGPMGSAAAPERSKAVAEEPEIDGVGENGDEAIGRDEEEDRDEDYVTESEGEEEERFVETATHG